MSNPRQQEVLIMNDEQQKGFTVNTEQRKSIAVNTESQNHQVYERLCELLGALPRCIDNQRQRLLEPDIVEVHVEHQLTPDYQTNLNTPLQGNNLNFVINPSEAIPDLNQHAFRLPEDRFRPLPADLCTMLRFDVPELADCEIDYQTVDYNLVVKKYVDHHVEQSAYQPINYPVGNKLPEIIVRFWRRFDRRIPINKTFKDELYASHECLIEHRTLFPSWKELCWCLPTSYPKHLRQSTCYEIFEGGKSYLKVDWQHEGNGVEDWLAYVVLALRDDATDAEQSLWPEPQPFPPSTGLGWE